MWECKEEEALPPVESPAAPEKTGSVAQIAGFELRLAVWAFADAYGIHGCVPPSDTYESFLSPILKTNTLADILEGRLTN
jgi:hypothetical protein